MNPASLHGYGPQQDMVPSSALQRELKKKKEQEEQLKKEEEEAAGGEGMSAPGEQEEIRAKAAAVSPDIPVLDDPLPGVFLRCVS